MSKDQIRLEVSGVTQKLGGKTILESVSFSIHEGECWAITGASGSGKTALAKALSGQSFVQGRISYDLPDSFGDNPQISFVAQQHQFRNLSNTDTFYYQQRYNSFDSEDSQTVGKYLASMKLDDSSLLQAWGLNEMTRKPLIQLSNGENKRLQLVIALAAKPAVLILDSPFTGLDLAARDKLTTMLTEIRAAGVLVILICRPTECPQFITHVLALDQGRIFFRGAKEAYTPAQRKQEPGMPEGAGFRIPTDHVPQSIVRMEEVSVRYGTKLILDRVDWQVNKGERWSVSGPNGAGKSTLLSLITGDNPQAYSNRIWLFDRRRGSGETIWEIKQKIGYVSPELHLSFERSATAFEVVASGLFDTIGLFRQLEQKQMEQVERTMEWLGLAGVVERLLFQLPVGQQRLVLLARALVRLPPLLILDEPCQGLDEEQSAFIKNMVDSICRNTDITLIYISHYVSDIPACVDRHLALENGRISTVSDQDRDQHSQPAGR